MKKILYTTIITLFFTAQVVMAHDIVVSIPELNLDTRADLASYIYSSDRTLRAEEKGIKELGERLVSYMNSTLDLSVLTKKSSLRNNGMVLYNDGTEYSDSFDASSTSDFLFSKSLDSYNYEGNTEGLPKGNEAQKQALLHLENLRLVPSTFENEAKLLHVGGLKLAVHNEDGSTAEFDKAVTVTYSREIAGLPVFGASRIVMRMGTNGELLSIVYRWPSVEKAVTNSRSVLQTSSRKVVSQLKELYKNDSTIKSIDVKTVDLVMFDDGIGYIEPALFVTGVILSGDGEYDSDWIIPVLDSPEARYEINSLPPVQPEVADEKALADDYSIDNSNVEEDE